MYPIVFVDPKNDIIGIVHAGWKGIERGIDNNSIDKMMNLGASQKNIIAYAISYINVV